MSRGLIAACEISTALRLVRDAATHKRLRVLLAGCTRGLCCCYRGASAGQSVAPARNGCPPGRSEVGSQRDFASKLARVQAMIQNYIIIWRTKMDNVASGSPVRAALRAVIVAAQSAQCDRWLADLCSLYDCHNH